METNPDEYLIELVTSKITDLISFELSLAYKRDYVTANKTKKELKETITKLQKTYPNLTRELLLNIVNTEIEKVWKKII